METFSIYIIFGAFKSVIDSSIQLHSGHNTTVAWITYPLKLTLLMPASKHQHLERQQTLMLLTLASLYWRLLMLTKHRYQTLLEAWTNRQNFYRI